jgi:predicted CoA-substrate-specific enzyme activase
MKFLGIDIGSRTIKAVLVDHDRIEWSEVVDATSAPLRVARSILDKYPGIAAMATGYGRHLLEMQEVPSITEIKACAQGVKTLCPAVRSIIDIGGQDIKIIVLDNKGKIAKFEMNDRCAAGTGRFLEIMAEKLDLSLDEFSREALCGSDTITISSLCTVFAESEVIGLLNGNRQRNDIARAVHRSVTRKIGGMVKRIADPGLPVVIAGGGALNPAVVSILRAELGADIRPLDNPQLACALGAALIGAANPVTVAAYQPPTRPL